MLSKNKIKLVTSLSYKKNRDETGLFVAEGFKLVEELSQVFHCEFIGYLSEKENEIASLQAQEKIPVSEDIMTKISSQKSPQGVLGVFKKNKVDEIDNEIIKSQLCIALDDIQDPGNLGTIIRLADWFGIRHVLCSEYSADVYSTKVIQATMGAIARVNVHYVDLEKFLSSIKNIPIYGAFLDGENIYSEKLSHNGIIVMGNEGNGISDKIARNVGVRLNIPSFSPDSTTTESLNVAVATAIICSEFRRRKIGK